jgi:hypothetical protein
MNNLSVYVRWKIVEGCSRRHELDVSFIRAAEALENPDRGDTINIRSKMPHENGWPI